MATRQRPGVRNTQRVQASPKPKVSVRVSQQNAQVGVPPEKEYKQAIKTLGNQARNETTRRQAATRANPTIPVQEQAARSNATRRSQARQSTRANSVYVGNKRSPRRVPNADRLGNAVAANERATFTESPVGRANQADRERSAALREQGPGRNAQSYARAARWNLNSNANSQRMPRRAPTQATSPPRASGRVGGGLGPTIALGAASVVYEDLQAEGRAQQHKEELQRRGRKRGYGATGRGPGVRR